AELTFAICLCLESSGTASQRTRNDNNNHRLHSPNTPLIMHREMQPLNPQMPANNGVPSGSTTYPGISDGTIPGAGDNGNSNTSEFTIKRRKQLSSKQRKAIRNLVKLQD